MRFHPAVLMLIVWLGATTAFIILPFQLTYRSIQIEGVVFLILNLSAFILGSLLKTVYIPQQPVLNSSHLQMTRADILLKTLATIACLSLGFEVVRNNALDLSSSYSIRSNQAQALLDAGLSESSTIFQIGFLCYPAAYVYLVRGILFDARPKWGQIIIFGLMPGVLAGLTMGGRTPIFNTMIYGLLAYSARTYLFAGNRNYSNLKVVRIRPSVKISAVIFAVCAIAYFINVFVVRAELVGGTDAMLEFAADNWGVTFAGPGADVLIATFGNSTTYLMFVMAWYLLQGIVMSNSLFVDYSGEPLMGIYGVDIISAIMRRLDSTSVSEGFGHLLNIDIYGFFPSAFGTLYVDFLSAGLVVSFVWGWLATLVYRNIRLGRDPRWFIFGPFVTLGILLSLINTPFGFSNGFITHVWLIITFLLIGHAKPCNPGQ